MVDLNKWALHERMVATRHMIGGMVEIMPTPRPWIITVAGPVLPDLEMVLTGR